MKGRNTMKRLNQKTLLNDLKNYRPEMPCEIKADLWGAYVRNIERVIKANLPKTFPTVQMKITTEKHTGGFFKIELEADRVWVDNFADTDGDVMIRFQTVLDFEYSESCETGDDQFVENMIRKVQRAAIAIAKAAKETSRLWHIRNAEGGSK